PSECRLVVLAPGNAGDGTTGLGAVFLGRARQRLARRRLDQRRGLLLALVLLLLVVLALALLGLGLSGDILERELAVVASPLNAQPPDAAVLELAEQQLIGQRFLDVLLNHARQGAGAEFLVIPRLRQPLGGVLRELDGDAAVGELRLELEYELLDH